MPRWWLATGRGRPSLQCTRCVKCVGHRVPDRGRFIEQSSKVEGHRKVWMDGWSGWVDVFLAHQFHHCDRPTPLCSISHTDPPFILSSSFHPIHIASWLLSSHRTLCTPHSLLETARRCTARRLLVRSHKAAGLLLAFLLLSISLRNPDSFVSDTSLRQRRTALLTLAAASPTLRSRRLITIAKLQVARPPVLT